MERTAYMMQLSDVSDKELPAVDAETIQAMRASAEAAAQLLRCIGSAQRLQILCLLTAASRTVTDICEGTGMRQSLASQHLARLRADGLVKSERQGHYVRYSLSKPVVQEIMAVLYRHFCPDVGKKARAPKK